ncbi:hypothetical protein BC830DRAFT_309986 [Chytriomyces sp. MP71]|nr:hypothetical protein BC830DRAFT_309986 [Chytriomyces sp. MP71]
MHCTLTVSVCRRDSSRRDHSSEIQMKDLKGHIHSPPSSQPYPSSIPQQPPTKSKMVALRRIAKKVYAAPYKSRMDVKDAFMNECAYPLVYYTVNDYESSDLHLHIQEKEYLCVELSVMVADQDQGGGYGHSSTASVMPLPPPVADDPTPFPVPDGFKKVVLFQGAVPYTALLDIFMQKGARPVGSGAVSSSSGTTGSGWGNLASKSLSSLNGRGSVTAPAERTEYIMMRGPRGKGVCQVAICENILADRPEVQISSPALPQSAPGASAPSSLLNMLGGTVKAGISILRSGLGAVGADDAALPGNTPGAGFRKPDALRCSMTYVNVPWHSIISDLVASHQAGNI